MPHVQTWTAADDSPAHPHVVPGLRYGWQSLARWAAGEGGARNVLDMLPCDMLWRVRAVGTNVLFAVRSGSSGTDQVELLRSPLEFVCAGQLQLTAQPIDPQLPAEALASVTVAGGSQLPIARSVQVAAGPIPRSAWRATALIGATVSVAGAAVVLPVGATLPLAEPSALVAGGPILLEHSP